MEAAADGGDAGMGEEMKAKVESLLRRAGLSHVNKSALCCVVVLAVVAVCVALCRFWPAASSDSFSLDAADAGAAVQQDMAADGASASETASAGASGASAAGTGASGGTSAAAASSTIAVDVEGAVVSPGVYTLASGSRVGDAIEAAGGFAEGAAAAQVNRAQKLEDGVQVYVAREGEAAAGSGAASASASSGAAGAAGSTQQAKVNINTATSEQLQTLQGVGEGIASRIIDYREKNGSFKKIEDLKNVSGIGDARFAAIEESITV